MAANFMVISSGKRIIFAGGLRDSVHRCINETNHACENEYSKDTFYQIWQDKLENLGMWITLCVFRPNNRQLPFNRYKLMVPIKTKNLKVRISVKLKNN